MPPTIRQELKCINQYFDGEEWTLETKSHRIYYYGLTPNHVEDVKPVLEKYKDKIEYIFTKRTNLHFD